MGKFTYLCPTKVYFGQGIAETAFAEELPTKMSHLKSTVLITPRSIMKSGRYQQSYQNRPPRAEPE